MKLLSHAMEFWSGGQLKAIFLEHEVSGDGGGECVCIYLIVAYGGES